MHVPRLLRLIGISTVALALLAGLPWAAGPGPLSASPSEPSSVGEAPRPGATSIVPPPPEAVARLKEQGRQLPPLHTLKASPPGVTPQKRAGSVNLLAILVDFSDQPARVTGGVAGTAFDKLVFSPPGPGRGSVADYFAEVSYGNLTLVTLNMPSTMGWKRAPQTYAYYVAGSYGMTPGNYPHNAGRMVEDLLPLVDSAVNFADYDNDGDGAVDTLLVMHAGTGAEFSLSPNDIWSHAASISLMGGTAQSLDGVTVDRYVTAPEYWDPSLVPPGSAATDMTIGVICHEIAHGLFGLPDLYDLDTSSYGIGRWGLMSYGDWNGPLKWNPFTAQWITDGSSPAWPGAWDRLVMGIDTYSMVVSPMVASIPPVEAAPNMIGRFKSIGLRLQEYFLLENRQQIVGSYDQYLPGSGILIWHVDEARWSIYGGPDNNSECRSLPNPHCWGACSSNHYLVALEQADGADDLEYKVNAGDTADPFPGSGGNLSWQWYGTFPPRNPESGTWYDTTCGTDSCIDIVNFNDIVSPPNVWLNAVRTACSQIEADLGDAPASLNHFGSTMLAYKVPPVQANFPTIYFPPANPTGPRHHFAQIDSWLGSGVSLEFEADLPMDQDGTANITPTYDLADRDSLSLAAGRDDGVPWPVLLDSCGSITMPYTVTIVPGAPTIPRFVNAWFDWNHDGDWADSLTCPGSAPVPEWTVQDQVLGLGPGTHRVSSPIFTPKVQITENAPFETWLRISLGDMPAPAPQDGRGPPQGYDLGETEDYLLFLHPALLLTTTLPYNPTPGDTVTLTVRYNALGNVQAGRVVISDVLQPGLTYVSSDPPGTYNPATRAITWTTSLVPHQPGTVTLTVRLGVGCGVGNTAYLLWGGSIWSRSSVSLDIPGATCMRLPLVLKHW